MVPEFIPLSSRGLAEAQFKRCQTQYSSGVHLSCCGLLPCSGWSVPCPPASLACRCSTPPPSTSTDSSPTKSQSSRRVWLGGQLPGRQIQGQIMPELTCAAGRHAPSGGSACSPAAWLSVMPKVNTCLIKAAGCLCVTYTAESGHSAQVLRAHVHRLQCV